MGTSFSRRSLLGGASRIALMIAGAAIPVAVGRSAFVSLADPSQPGLSSEGASVLKFYVGSHGDDSADGLTVQTAWATLERVRASIPKDRPSTVLFRRGDTFYGEWTLPAGCAIGAYGTGEKPVLTMYKLLNVAGGWAEHAAGVWKIDLGSAATHEGYNLTSDANIGFLLVDGVVKPNLKFALSELTAPWDFTCDLTNKTMYVSVPANPTTLAADIRAAPNGDAPGGSGTVLFCPNGDNEVSDVHITGSGGCGIRGSGFDVHIHDCLIDYIGGSRLVDHADGKSRYGNGVENWINVSNWLIEGNEIAQVYDAAWSPQGSDPQGGAIYWRDITVRKNYIHDCGQTFEIWSESSNPEAPGFARILFEGNMCERAGYGPFSGVRPNQDVRVHLLTYNLQTPVDVTIRNNVFDDAYGAYSYHTQAPPDGYVTESNMVRLRAGHRMEVQRSETVEQAAQWQAETNSETGSSITVL